MQGLEIPTGPVLIRISEKKAARNANQVEGTEPLRGGIDPLSNRYAKKLDAI